MCNACHPNKGLPSQSCTLIFAVPYFNNSFIKKTEPQFVLFINLAGI